MKNLNVQRTVADAPRNRDNRKRPPSTLFSRCLQAALPKTRIHEILRACTRWQALPRVPMPAVRSAFLILSPKYENSVRLGL